MRRAFAQPRFKRLFGGLTASMLGDSMMLLVLSMWVKTLTGSNSLAGLTFFFMVVPALFAPLLGVWIDRVRRKPLLVWGNLASAAVVAPLVLVRDASDVWLVWAVAFGYGISFIVLPAALNGLLKELLPEDLLVEANASLQTTKQGFRLFGPLLGAALFAGIGGWLVALIDVATFLVAAAVIATIPVQEHRPDPDPTPLRSQLTVGLRHLVADRLLKHLLAGFGLTLLVLGFSEAAIYALLDGFDRPASYAGVLVSVQGVGAVLGGLVVSRLVKQRGEIAAATLGLLAMALGSAGIAAAPTLTMVLAFIAVLGVSLPFVMVSYMTLLQRRTPQRVMGRVSTAVEVVLTTPQAISLALGSLLVVLLDWRAIFAIKAVAILIAAGYVAVRLRDQLHRRPVPEKPPARSLAEATATGQPTHPSAEIADVPPPGAG
ncbi:MFS transporter [Nocardioides sp. GCM10027113]|uniref:MFS transporter n=1 Tax=unclassified Nocardioides TaxID=2615069 RepID=UPI00362080BB